MKNTTKKILFFLTRPQQRELLLLSGESLRQLVPEITDSGYRSLLSLLKKDGLITVESITGETKWRISDAGTQALRHELPVLDLSLAHWQGEWSCLVFNQAPAHDRQFRYLRDLLIKQGALALNRGIYLYPGEFPETVIAECRSSYLTNVSILAIKEWLFGDERMVITEKYALLDLAQTYSGISSEIDRLIERKKAFSDMNHQQKMRFITLFDRLYSAAQDDTGLLTHYFPQVPSLWQLLSRLQSVFL